MGKKLIIKGADFSNVAIEVGIIRTFIYNISDNQFLSGDGEWAHTSGGFSIVGQSGLQNKTLHGVRLNVAVSGTVKVYKASLNNPSNMNLLTLVATLTTNRTGLQNIDFSEPISLGSSEYIVIGDANNVGSNTLQGTYHRTGGNLLPVQQRFYFKAGQSEVSVSGETTSLDIDFYQIQTDEQE